MDVCKVDESVINDLLGMISLKGRTAEKKFQIYEDARPCPLWPKVKGTEKDKRIAEFLFEWPKYIR